MDRNAFRGCLAAGLIALFVALFLTHPLACHLREGMPFKSLPEEGRETTLLEPGDHLQLLYHLWLLKDFFLSGGPFFSDPYEFQVGEEDIFTVRRLPLSLLFLPFTPLGDVAAYNCLLILCLVLAALSAYRLAWSATERFLPSLFAGLLYAFNPFMLAQIAGGHTGAFLAFLLPLLLLALDGLFSKAKARYAAAVALLLVSMALIEYHLLYYSFHLIPFFVLYLLWREGTFRKRGWKRTLFCILSLGIAMAVAATVVLWISRTEIHGSTESAGRPFRLVLGNSPNWRDLFNPLNPDAEKTVYLGPLPLALGGLPLLLLLAGRGKREGALPVLFFSSLFGFSVLLALGLSLNNYIPLYRFLFFHWPKFAFIRVPGRLILFSFLALSYLSALGMEALLERGRKALAPFTLLLVLSLLIQTLVARYLDYALPSLYLLLALAVVLLFLYRGIVRIGLSLLVLCLILGYRTGRPWGITLLPGKNPVWEKIGKEAGGKRLLEIPLWPGDAAHSSVYLYGVTKTRVPLINGYYPIVPRDYVERIFRGLVGANVGDLTERMAGELRDLDVAFLTVHQEVFPEKVSHYPSYFTVRRFMQSPHLAFEGREGPLWLFRLRGESEGGEATAPTSPVGVLREGERLARKTGSAVDDPEAGNGRAARAQAGRDPAGFLAYKRQQVFPKGRYVASFRLKCSNANPDDEVARIGVGPYGERELYAQRILKGQDFAEAGRYIEFLLPFEQPEPLFLNFLVHFSGGGDLWLDHVYVLPEGQEDPCTAFEAEDLFYPCAPEEDAEASGGLSVPLDPEGFAYVSGPFRKYGPGRYRARYRLRCDGRAEGALGTLIVSSDLRGETIARRDLSSEDFASLGEYTTIDVPFRLDREKVLEFRISQNRRVPLRLDRIELIREE